MREELLEVAEIIENHWCKGLAYDGKGNYCLLGAIGLINHDCNRKEWFKDVRRVATVIPVISSCCDNRPDATAKVVHYNDFHCTGGLEAAKILREAAEVELKW